jgi:hypothetical protein
MTVIHVTGATKYVTISPAGNAYREDLERPYHRRDQEHRHFGSQKGGSVYAVITRNDLAHNPSPFVPDHHIWRKNHKL